jgi:NAD(P)-dependent dehydrogenase (short-subunit alcohol dehydrogenase family)
MYEAPFWKGPGKLEGKKAIITGGDSGSGREVAVLFAREGADVAILHLAEEEEDADITRVVWRRTGSGHSPLLAT